jgi:hypothetical protein
MLLRIVLRELRQTSVKRSCAEVPEAERLRQIARVEAEKTAAARAERRELERRAALDDIAAKTALEEAKHKAATARRQALESSSAIRLAELQRVIASARARREARWLQTVFPVALATRLLEWRRGLGPAALEELTGTLKSVLRTQRCLRTTEVPLLWTDDKTLAAASCSVAMPGGGGKTTAVRCTRDFEWVLFGEAWAAQTRSNDVAHALAKLFDRILPSGSHLFFRRYNPHVLLETCDFVAHKAFVHGVVLLSKWLGPDHFPQGVFAWPPVPPADITGTS